MKESHAPVAAAVRSSNATGRDVRGAAGLHDLITIEEPGGAAGQPLQGRTRGAVDLCSGWDLLRLLLRGVPVPAGAVQELDRAGGDLHSSALGAVRRLPGGRFQAC
jgi:hypothetical protein